MLTLDLPFPKAGPLHILVVDDQNFDRTMIANRLREVAPADTHITECNSGEAALDAISRTGNDYDCVLLDMNLPDIHGVELTTQMLSLKPELTIVMITVEADMDKALKCLKAGAQDFLIKGEYTNIGLYRAMRYAMERHAAAHENIRLNKALDRERELTTVQKEFIHLVSHEFRTPIAIISGAAQLLATKAPALSEGDGKPQFRKIHSAVARLVGLLDNVLRLSMLEEGKEVFSPEWFDVGTMAKEVVECFEQPRITCDAGVNPIRYYGDQRLVEYALHNLISNALKYSAEDAPVRVIIAPQAEGIQISVIDQGAGMSADAVARMGEKFHREAHTSHIEGTGLGIHLARRFAEYHQGSLRFESALGEGTTVHLFLPHTKQG